MRSALKGRYRMFLIILSEKSLVGRGRYYTQSRQGSPANRLSYFSLIAPWDPAAVSNWLGHPPYVCLFYCLFMHSLSKVARRVTCRFLLLLRSLFRRHLNRTRLNIVRTFYCLIIYFSLECLQSKPYHNS